MNWLRELKKKNNVDYDYIYVLHSPIISHVREHLKKINIFYTNFNRCS